MPVTIYTLNYVIRLISWLLALKYFSYSGEAVKRRARLCL